MLRCKSARRILAILRIQRPIRGQIEFLSHAGAGGALKHGIDLVIIQDNLPLFIVHAAEPEGVGIVECS